MLNNPVIKMLTDFAKVTPSVVLKYPTSILSNDYGDLRIRIDMSKLDLDSFDVIAIEKLQEFIGITKLFDPEKIKIDYNTPTLVITDGETKVDYITSSEVKLKNYSHYDGQFEKTEVIDTVASFKLSTSDFNKIGKASSVFKTLENLEIKATQDKDIDLTLTSAVSFQSTNTKSNTFSMSKTPEINDMDLTIKIPIENLIKLPSDDYTIEVKYNQTHKAYRLYITSDTKDYISIIMSVLV